MLKIITCNLNGIRSATRKGFFDWLRLQNADIICLQELKAQAHHLEDEAFLLRDYHSHFHFAEKKGYSGVGIYSRFTPIDVITGLGFQVADQEGRYVALNLGPLWVASLYMPSGTSGEERQRIKYDFLDRYKNHLQEILNKKQEFIICGDLNIAHKEVDLKNWRGNQKNSGFLPAERAWLDHLFVEMGFVDAFREVNQAPDQYTWWSHRGRAREKNVGWRIDYQVLSPGLKSSVHSAAIYHQEKFSDHAPLIMEYNLQIPHTLTK